MKKPLLNTKNLATGAFLLGIINGSLCLTMAYFKAEAVVRYSPNTLADPQGNVLMREYTPFPIESNYAHLIWGGLAVLNFSFATSLLRGKRLSIYKEGEEVFSLPKEPTRLLMAKGYLPKSESLIPLNEFADEALETSQKMGQHLALSGFELIQDGLTLGLAGAGTGGKFLYDLTIPPEVQSIFESKLAEFDNGYSQFKSNSIHAKITGATGSGKTYLAWDYLASWVEKHQCKGQILVADINYLKPDNNGKVNDWLGIDRSRVYDSTNRILDLFAYLREQLDERVVLCQNLLEKAREKNPEAIHIDISKVEPMLIIIDEYSSLVADLLASEGKEWLQENFYPILKQCRAYKMQFLLLDQTNARNQSEMPMAIASQFSKMVIAKGDIDDSELKYLGVTGDYKNQLLSQVEQLVSSGKRVAIAQIGEGKARTITLPDLSNFSYRFAPKPDQERWLDKHKATILNLIKEGKKKTNICQILKDAGEKNLNRQSSDNPYYQALSEFYDQQMKINLNKVEV